MSSKAIVWKIYLTTRFQTVIYYCIIRGSKCVENSVISFIFTALQLILNNTAVLTSLYEQDA